MRPADRIFTNGKVVTVDRNFTTCSAIAVAGDRIIATGSDAEVSAHAGEGTEVIDLAGRTVIPGLIDTHAHLDREGLKSVYPSLAGAASIDDILDRIAALVEKARPGEWIVTMPIGNPPSYWSPQDTLKERRWPTRWDLDRVSPDNPVYIRPIWGYWRGRLPIVSVVNSRALAVCGIDENTPPPAPTVTLEKDASGRLTGIFTEHTFMSIVELTLMGGTGRFSHRDRVEALRRSMQAYASFGTTSVFEGHGAAGELLKAYYALKEQGPFAVRANLLFSPAWTHFGDIPFSALLGTWGAWLGQRGIGDNELRVGGLYVCAEDENDLSRSPVENALRASATPYTGWAGFHYDAYLPREKAKRLLIEAAANGIRCAAMTLDMLDMFVEVNRVVPIADQRWIIGHISVLRDDDIAKMRDLGLVVSTHTNRYIWRDRGQDAGRRRRGPGEHDLAARLADGGRRARDLRNRQRAGFAVLSDLAERRAQGLLHRQGRRAGAEAHARAGAPGGHHQRRLPDVRRGPEGFDRAWQARGLRLPHGRSADGRGRQHQGSCRRFHCHGWTNGVLARECIAGPR